MMKKALCLVTALAAAALWGCTGDEKEPSSREESSAVTEEVTEAPTEPETEAPTEPETEAPTEPETEASTEPETENAAQGDGSEERPGRMWTVSAESPVLSSINTPDSPWKLSVALDSKEAAESLSVQRSGYANVMDSPAVLGQIIELSCGADVESVELRFQVKEEHLANSLGKYPDVAELQGISRLNVFTWVEELNMALPLETTFDGNMVICRADRLGTYELVDMELWLANMGIEPEELVTGE